MNPVRSYFQWHDRKYLRYMEDPRKLRGAIRMFSAMRVVLFVLSAVLWTLLLAAMALTLIQKSVLPEATIPVLGVVFAPVIIFYTWVTEALLFRQYIQKHNEQKI
jgi:membrane protease YdiL (CAAX protease family)